MGKPFLDVWSEAREVIAPQLEKALRGESCHHRDAPFTLIRNEVAETAWFDYSFSPLRDESGMVAGVLNTAVETTERVRARKALAQSERRFRAMFEAAPVGMAQADPETRRLLRVNPAFCTITGYSEAELLELTVDDLNHPDDRDPDRVRYAHLLELRTPLSGIIGCASLLQEGVLGPLIPEQKEAVSRIRTSSHYLLEIIDEILTFSRLDAGREEVRSESVDVAAVVRDVVEVVELQAEARPGSLSVRGAAAPLLVRTDPGKLRKILINLVGNALTHAPGADVTVELERPVREDVRIHVRDTGPGISAEDQARIFEPVMQVDTLEPAQAPGWAWRSAGDSRRCSAGTSRSTAYPAEGAGLR